MLLTSTVCVEGGEGRDRDWGFEVCKSEKEDEKWKAEEDSEKENLKKLIVWIKEKVKNFIFEEEIDSSSYETKVLV